MHKPASSRQNQELMPQIWRRNCSFARSLRQRSQSGSGIIEGTLGISMIIGFLVSAVLLLTIVGFFCLYKIKIGWVATQAAQYCAGLLSNNHNVNATEAEKLSVLNELDKRINLMIPAVLGPGVSSTVTVEQIDPDGGQNVNTVKCTITVTGLVWPVKNLPLPLSFTETATADLTSNQPPGLLITFPLSRLYANANSNTGLPKKYWESGQKGNTINEDAMFKVVAPCYGTYLGDGSNILYNFPHPCTVFNVWIPGHVYFKAKQEH